MLVYILLPLLIPALIAFAVEKPKLYIKKFLIYFVLGLICSTVPYLHFGIFMGYPAYTIMAAIVPVTKKFLNE